MNLSVMEMMDAPFGLGLQPKYKCLQMVLDVYLNRRVGSGSAMESLNLQRPECVSECVTLCHTNAHICPCVLCVCASV